MLLDSLNQLDRYETLSLMVIILFGVFAHMYNKHTVSSRLIDGFCYFYYNGYETYEDAQSICQQHFEFHGFQDGRLYEPRVPTNHELVYKAGKNYEFVKLCGEQLISFRISAVDLGFK